MTLRQTDSEKFEFSPWTLLFISFTLILVWGTAYTMVSVAVRHISPIWLVAGRTLTGGVLVTAYAYWRGHRFPPLTDIRWRWYFVLALTGMVIPFFLLSTGQKTVDSGVASIMAGAMPLMTIILAHFFANEDLTWRKSIGFVVGFLGIVILFLPTDLSLDLVSNWRGQVLILIAAGFYAGTAVAVKRAPDTPSSLGAAMMVLLAGLSSLVLALITGLPEQMPPLVAWWMILGLGAGSTGLATILYIFVIQKSGPSLVAKINYFPPVASVAAGVLLLGEPFTWRIVASFSIIALGVLLSRSGTKSGGLREKN